MEEPRTKSRVHLENPAVAPNPAIKALLDISHDLFARAITEPGEIGFLYAEADQAVTSAIQKLFNIKNVMAEEHPPGAPKPPR